MVVLLFKTMSNIKMMMRHPINYNNQMHHVAWRTTTTRLCRHHHLVSSSSSSSLVTNNWINSLNQEDNRSLMTINSHNLMKEKVLFPSNKTTTVSFFSTSSSNCYSIKKPSFISSLIQNVKQEMARNQEMKQSLEKFREEAKKLEETEALKKAREKYDSIESTTSKSLDSVKHSIYQKISQAQETEVIKKTKAVSEEIAKRSVSAAEEIIKVTSDSAAVKSIGRSIESVIDVNQGIYRKPTKLRKRKDYDHQQQQDTIKINPDETRIEMSQESKWSSSWKSFTDNNRQVFDKIFSKFQSSPSDEPSTLGRNFGVISEKVTDFISSIFSVKNELSETLTEIIKVEPNFDRNNFCNWLQTQVIPNLLEAQSQSDVEILRDWMFEGAFNIVSQPIKSAASNGQRITFEILDISSVELLLGKVVDQGPVLVVSFVVQQTTPVVIDIKTGKRIVTKEAEAEDKVLRVNHVWVFCRDVNEVDPEAAWKVLEVASSSSDQFL